MIKTIMFLWTNRKKLFNVILGLSGAFLLAWCINVHITNKKLSEGLKNAKLNIEMYLNVIAGANELNNTLMLTIDELKTTKDSLIVELNKRIEKSTPKSAKLETVATQTQVIYVNGGKGVIENITDTILFNDETIVSYTIHNDSINVTLDISNTQDLYVYKVKEYKNKKNFFKRLITFDWKKILKELYKILNSNDLILTSDVRVIKITQ